MITPGLRSLVRQSIYLNQFFNAHARVSTWRYLLVFTSDSFQEPLLKKLLGQCMCHTVIFSIPLLFITNKHWNCLDAGATYICLPIHQAEAVIGRSHIRIFYGFVPFLKILRLALQYSSGQGSMGRDSSSSSINPPPECID
jgi:hypothetical protein